MSAIKLTDDNSVPNQVQILRVGKFNHPKYGAFEITSQTLAEMVQNHKNNVRGLDLSFDYFHDSDREASAWVRNLELRENETELWATEVEWTPTARKKLFERELRYFSPDFAFKWTDPEKGLTFSNVLFGGALTNRPFVKEMAAIVAHENQEGENMTDLEKAQKEVADLKAANLKLSEDMKAVEKKMEDMPQPDKVAQLEAQIKALQDELAKAKGEVEASLAEKQKAEAAKVLAEKENEFNVLLSEGKACVAQKPAFMKGDMKEFVKLAQPLNLKANGSSNSTTQEDDDTKAIIKLAEEKEKANPKLSRGEAISIAKKELKK